MHFMDILQLELGGFLSTIGMTEVGHCLAWEGGLVDLVVADSNTVGLVPPGTDLPVVVVPAGEACKDFSVLEYLLDQFARQNLRRDSVIAALGGGAVTDLAAFAAAIFLRGITVVLVPTSLLAMVDAAVGGKTGIDFGGFKNLVGAFHPAREVRLVPEFLRTLSEREYRSGLAEVIKAAFLGDAELLELLEQRSADVMAREPEVLRELIRRAVLVKCGVVARDFTEQGERAYLNLGHTFGHALEACLGLGEWTHGEAVAWGIARAMEAGLAAGVTDPAWAERVLRLLNLYGYPLEERPVSADELIAAMDKDKKKRRGGLFFILQEGPFKTVQRTLDRDILESILTVDRRKER